MKTLLLHVVLFKWKDGSSGAFPIEHVEDFDRL